MTASLSISVVIPCFNAERYIAAALRSVVAQEWPSLEIIVVDDGSTDRSSEIVREKFPAVLLLQQPNQGVASARNLGIESCRGDWVAFLDADDIWLPGKLQAQISSLGADVLARMSYSAWQVWESDGDAPRASWLEKLASEAAGSEQWAGPSGWIYPQLLLDCEVWTSTVLVHRSVFNEIGVFDTTLRVGEDYDMWLRASRVTPILRVAKPLALYRTHPASITRSATDINAQSFVISRALARWGYRSPDGAVALKRDVDRALARSWSAYAGAHLDAGRLDKARHGGLMSMRTDPWLASGWKILAKTMVRSLAAGHRRGIA